MSNKTAQEIAVEMLREMFPVGHTVQIILRHVSDSGMGQSISVLNANNHNVSHLVARALGWSFDFAHTAVKVPGARVDMGANFISTLSHLLHDDGYALDYRWGLG